MNICLATFLMAFGFVSAAENTTASRGCPGKWVRIGSDCHFIQADLKLSWYDALDYCHKRGGRLAEPLTQEDDQRIGSSLLSSGNAYWLGLRQGEDGKFHFQSTNDIVSYQAWRMFNPSNTASSDNCVTMKCLGWSDYNCTAKHPFVCQRHNITAAITTTMPSSTSVRLSSTMGSEERSTINSSTEKPDKDSKGHGLFVWTPGVFISIIFTSVFI